ncbi:MAG: sugar-binding transcriptional regulator, partial [Anaerolineae bacterium]|nr:sugar-binding transcriptional regulator [Anaerolineae bacterium]
MDEGTRILLKVARLYYQEGLTQQEIADNLRLSRPKISRLLQQARDQQIVQIKIVAPFENFTDLENKLEKKYNLKEVIVVNVKDSDSRSSVSRELGIAAAKYLDRTVQDGDLIGFTWGSSLSVLADSITPENKNNIRVIQMVGGLGEPNTDIHAIDIAKRVAIVMNANLTLLPAPGIVGSVEVRQILLADRSVKQAMELAPQADIVFVGIGAPEPNSLIVQGNIMSWDEMKHLIDLGAVGDIGLHFFDIQGNQILSEVEDRVIG